MYAPPRPVTLFVVRALKISFRRCLFFLEQPYARTNAVFSVGYGLTSPETTLIYIIQRPLPTNPYNSSCFCFAKRTERGNVVRRRVYVRISRANRLSVRTDTKRTTKFIVRDACWNGTSSGVRRTRPESRGRHGSFFVRHMMMTIPMP